ncbi:hypothetical protein DRH27_05495 [Candidatus Falkowbacteria bacterium]|nr:MAG: hypothetical protein DRH27_05495 [Candidatus Falkowbacteria bacterium]
MAALHGRAGVVQIEAVAVGEIKSWSYKENTSDIDVTAMGATGKAFLGGLPDGTFDIECNWDPADAGQEDILDGLSAGTSITVNLYPSGTTTAGADYYTGSITITTSEVSGGVDDAVNSKFSGRGFLVLGTVAA